MLTFLKQDLRCKSDKQCNIHKTECGFCRFQKCLSVGMKVEMVKQNVNRSRIIFWKRFQVLTNKSLNQSDSGEDNYLTTGYSRGIPPLTSAGLFEINQDWNPRSSLIPMKRNSDKIVWLNQNSSSHFLYEVVDVSFVQGGNYRVLVTLKDSLPFEYNGLMYLANQQKAIEYNESVLDKNCFLSLQTRDGLQIFQRCSPDVLISTFSANSSLVIQSVSDNEWSRLQEVICASKYFQKVTSVNILVDAKNPLVRLGYDVDNNCRGVSRAIEELKFFRLLDPEDQIIVLKESFCFIMFLLLAYAYDEEQEAVNLWALEGKLNFCIHANRFLTENTTGFGVTMFDFNRFFVINTYNFLRKDFFVITIVSILYSLQDWPGLSFNQMQSERNHYFGLLDKYIKAKIKNKEWPGDRDSIWSHIQWMLNQSNPFNWIWGQFVKEMEGNKDPSQLKIQCLD